MRRATATAWACKVSTSALLCALGCHTGQGSNTSGPQSASNDGGVGSRQVGAADTADEFCASLIGLSVEFGRRCVGGSTQTWTRLLDPTFECAHAQSALEAGRLQFSRSDARTCLSAAQILISTSDCDSGSTPAPVTSACQAALAGSVPIGGTCKSFHIVEFFQECVRGAYCKQAASADCSGTCTAYGKSGDSCDGIGERCELPLSCTNGKCQLPAKQGEACGGADQLSCGKGLSCDQPSAGQAGACVPRKTTGSCMFGSDCVSGSMCDASGQCAPVKHQGDSCSAGECGSFAFCEGGRCNEQLPGIGQACGMIDQESRKCIDGYCERPAGADSGTCAPFKHAGDSCAISSECTGDNAHCDSTTMTCTACD